MHPALCQTWRFLSGARRDSSSSSSPSTTKPPLLLAYRSSGTFILATVCLAIFTDIFLYGLIVPVMPYSLTVQAGVPDAEVQTWNAVLLGVYNGALCIGSPIAGWYADRTDSRRWPLLLGLLALAGSTLLLCLGRAIAVLVAGRLLQGLSAAIVWSVGLALLADTMGDKMGLSVGYVSISLSLGLFVSPLVGGVIYERAGYYAVYYVAFALIFCDIVLRLVMIEKKIARQWLVEDTDRAVGLSENPEESSGAVGEGATSDLEQGIAKNQTAKDKGGTQGEPAQVAAASSSDAVPVSPASSPQGKKVHPTLTLLKSTRMLAALFGCVIIAGIMFAFDTVVPIFVKDTFHWSSTAAGLIFFAIFIPGFASPLVGLLSDRVGARYPALAGFAATLPLLACLRFVSEDTTPHKVLLCALLALLGASTTLCNVPLMAEITYSIEAEERENPGVWGDKGVYGIGYGLYTTAFALGGTVGSFMAGYVSAGRGWPTMTWALAVYCAPGIVVSALCVGGGGGRRNWRRWWTRAKGAGAASKPRDGETQGRKQEKQKQKQKQGSSDDGGGAAGDAGVVVSGRQGGE